MRLYFLRHADAATPADSDEERALSAKGLNQAKRVAEFLEAHEIRPALILTSPVLRAFETARIVAEALEIECESAPFLSCGMMPSTAMTALAEYDEHESLMLVGHEPDFSRFAAHLLGTSPAASLRIRKASLTLLELDVLRPGVARLHFSIPCKMM